MSATVGTSFLSTTDRVREALSEPSQEQVGFEDKFKTALDGDNGLKWWRDAKRPLAWRQPEASEPKTGGGKKRRASPRRSCRARVSQTLCGFLNGDGGQVLLSVEGYG